MQGKAQKIANETLDELERVLDELPPYRSEEVTRTDAVRRLLPRIHALQSKGYPLRVIERMLSERGLVVTAGAIKRLMRSTAGRGAKKKKPRLGTPPAKAGTTRGGTAASRATASEVNEPSPVTGSLAEARTSDGAPTAVVPSCDPPAEPARTIERSDDAHSGTPRSNASEKGVSRIAPVADPKTDKARPVAASAVEKSPSAGATSAVPPERRSAFVPRKDSDEI